MRRLAFLLLLVPACAPRYRTETLGTGTAGGAGVTLSATGAHTVTWAVSTPRALKLHWALACGGATADGVTGEAFADYQTRRLAELRAEKQKEKDAVASLIGAVGATAVVRTPDAEAGADVHADGAAVADAVVSDDVALPAGDLGAGVYRGSATITAIEPGACTMTVTPEDPTEDPAGVAMEFQVTRTIDLGIERANEQARRRDGAIAVRGELTAALVAQGADPDLQRKRAAEVEADLRIRADVELRAQAELDAQLRAEVQVEVDAETARRAAALEVRDRLRAQLIGFGADPDFQANQAARLDAELRIRLDVEARAQAELDAQLRAEAQAKQDAAWRAREDALARIEAALQIRAQLTATLIAQGADPDFQRKRMAQIEADLRVRAEADARAQAEIDAQLWAEQDAHDRARAERRRRIDGALAVRVELLAYLEGLGAFAIPPMPELPYEDQGASPGSGSVWIAGEWVWRDRQWLWISGGWSIPTGVARVDTTVETTSDATGSGGVSVEVHVPVIVIEHRDDPPPPRPKTRDHRK